MKEQLLLPAPSLPERNPLFRGSQNQVINEPHSNYLSSLAESSCERQVLGRRRGIPTRMCMEEHDSCGVTRQSNSKQLPRLDRGAIERSTEDLLLGDQSIPSVEEESPHDLLVWQSESKHQVSRYRGRLREGVALTKTGPSEPARQLHTCENRRRLSGTYAAPSQSFFPLAD